MSTSGGYGNSGPGGYRGGSAGSSGGSSQGRPGGPGGPRRFMRSRKACVFCVEKVQAIDYKSVNRLRRYVSDRARIESGKRTGTCARHQRMLRTAIKRARIMALLPFAPDHVRVTGPISTGVPGVRGPGGPAGEAEATEGSAVIPAVDESEAELEDVSEPENARK